MRSLLYASRAVRRFDDDELVELLSVARRANDEHGVTGMLAYASRSFLQVLEGEDADVQAIWDRIRRDPRHCEVRVLEDVETRRRSYGAWSMGFAHPDPQHLEATLPGFRPGDGYPFVDAQLVASAEMARDLLRAYAGSDPAALQP